jgi:hypothetical protein
MAAQQQDNMMLDNSSSNQFSSHGITFRDPETGVLYVQMQLLQVILYIILIVNFQYAQILLNSTGVILVLGGKGDIVLSLSIF